MMIKSSVVQYLAECLLSQAHSEYTVRYSLALLLNVSLRCIGESVTRRNSLHSRNTLETLNFLAIRLILSVSCIPKCIVFRPVCPPSVFVEV